MIEHGSTRRLAMTQAVRAAIVSPFPVTFSYCSHSRSPDEASAALWFRRCNAPSTPFTSASGDVTMARFAAFAASKELVLLASKVHG